MSRRRQQRRVEKARRQLQPTHRPRTPLEEWPVAAEPPQVVVRQANQVKRLAYSRSQAAQALGISRSTLRRLLPYIEVIEMPWGGKLIPVDELERVALERRRVGRERLEPATRGRRPAVSREIAKRIRDERARGRSLSQIADDLNADRIPTAHGGARWWPSTVRAIVVRAEKSA